MFDARATRHETPSRQLRRFRVRRPLGDDHANADRDEHFYQLGLRQFGGFGRLKLDPPPALSQLLTVAAEAESGIVEAGLSVEGVVKVLYNLFKR